jgi:hypothetical protein
VFCAQSLCQPTLRSSPAGRYLRCKCVSPLNAWHSLTRTPITTSNIKFRLVDSIVLFQATTFCRSPDMCCQLLYMRLFVKCQKWSALIVFSVTHYGNRWIACLLPVPRWLTHGKLTTHLPLEFKCLDALCHGSLMHKNACALSWWRKWLTCVYQMHKWTSRSYGHGWITVNCMRRKDVQKCSEYYTYTARLEIKGAYIYSEDGMRRTARSNQHVLLLDTFQ